MDLKARSLEYFYNFSSKNSSALSWMFTSVCFLHDWENDAAGKTDVMSVYNKIFNSVESIAVTPRAIYQDGLTVIAELLITINGKEQILVTDVITYDETGKIVSVRAYKG
jgi:hypothetical protein